MEIHGERLSLEGVVERVASTSFVAAMDPQERAGLLDEVRAAAAELDEPIVVPYVTDAFVADRL